MCRKRIHTPESLKARTREYGKKYQRNLRQRIVELLGRKCVRCGFNDWRALQVDHVNGGGDLERRTLKLTTIRFIDHLLASHGKYQLLCANCNWIKRYENHEIQRPR